MMYRRPGGGERRGRRGRDHEIPAQRHRKKCGFCASDCGSYRYIAAPGTTTGESITVHPFCYRFRQEPEVWLETSKLTADLGINGWETAYGIIPWLQMCKQHGLVDPGWERSELDGAEIPVPDEPIQRLHDIAPIPAEFSSTLLHKMAYRKGELGNAVADGACYAAQALFGGQGLPLLDYIYPRRAGQTSHWNAHWIHPVHFPFLITPLLEVVQKQFRTFTTELIGMHTVV